MSDVVACLRNLGIVAHINAGKTTLSERILFDSGRVRFMGEVDAGTAALDYLPEEQRRGISIRAAATSVRWRGCLLNLVDTPGHVDFGAEVSRTLRVLDGAVVVLDGVRGVEPQTEAAWRQTRAFGLPALVFINKLDRPVADWSNVLGSLRERLAARVLPAVVPIVGEAGLCGLVDVVSGARQEWATGGGVQLDPVRARIQLVEAAADFDSTVMDDFVLDRHVDDVRLRAALRAGVMRGELVLAFAGSALHNRGVDVLLDGICDYLPSPADRPPVRGLDGAERVASPDAPVCALVFRAFREDGEAWLAVRMYSGTIQAGSVLARGDDGATLAVRAIGRMHADHRETVASAGPGDIVALAVDAANVATGMTLFAPGHPIALAPVRFAAPVLSVTIEPRHADDAPVVAQAATQLALADPTLAVRHDESRGVMLLSGMGELHLEVAAQAMRATVGDRFRVGLPEVACRETVRRGSSGQGEWRIPELGSRAVVQLSLEPAPGGGPARVRLRGEPSDPDLGMRLVQAMAARLAGGLLEGWPAFDVEVCIDDAAGTSDTAADVLPVCIEAAEVALRRALADADPVVLEPVVRLEVTCPHEALSPVLGDLRGKDVEIAAIDADGASARVRGTVPLARMLGYSTRLRSLTRGLGGFSFEPHGYAARERRGRG